MAETKPKVLILGGCGFIGRNLVKHLLDNKLVSFIRVADKSLPATSAMHPAHKASFDNKELVHFKQADLSRQPMAAGVFADHKFDYVINLCGETRANLPELDYTTKCVTTATTTGAEAVKAGITKWIEISHAWVYPSDAKDAKEENKTGPWTKQGSKRLEAETAVRAISGLPVVTLRPAIVYGQGDQTGLCPRITVAAVYKKMAKKMEMLWDANLKLNTVHVDDVCAAIWVACTEAAPGSVYNLADSGNTDQGKLNAILGRIFGIQTGFVGMAKNIAARSFLDQVASYCNGQTIPVWQALTQEHKIANTPLSPYLDEELCKEAHVSVNGSKITRETSFRYAKPELTEALVRASIEFQIAQGIFPPVL